LDKTTLNLHYHCLAWSEVIHTYRPNSWYFDQEHTTSQLQAQSRQHVKGEFLQTLGCSSHSHGQSQAPRGHQGWGLSTEKRWTEAPEPHSQVQALTDLSQSCFASPNMANWKRLLTIEWRFSRVLPYQFKLIYNRNVLRFLKKLYRKCGATVRNMSILSVEWQVWCNWLLTFEMVSAGLHWSFKMSRQIEPWLFTFGW
jgi:hypothetical protein